MGNTPVVYGNPHIPNYFCSGYCFCLILGSYTNFVHENGGRCGTIGTHAIADYPDRILSGSSRQLNLGKVWFSMIHPDSYNERDGTKRWCNDFSCKSYLLVGEPHTAFVPENEWMLRHPCRWGCV